MNKSAIQKFAVQARTDLIAQVKQQAYNYGIDATSFADKDAEIVNGTALSKDKVNQRRKLIDEIQRDGYEQVMERVAYTWFNRFIALRFMEVNDYLPSHIRVFSNDKGEFKPEILTNALSLELDGLDKEKVMELLDNPQGAEDLYRYLLLTQCNALHSALPQMFEKMGGYAELLLPLKILSDDSVIASMVNDIEEDDFKEAVEIIGWLYQYYNITLKKNADSDVLKGKKVCKELVPATTQLFTPDWIVRYMVENSIGRIAVDKFGVDPVSMGWKYYLGEAEQTEEVQKQLKIINSEKTTLEELKVIDPCMGSGHILVYAFDVLMQIYENQGYTSRDAVASIIENNIFGLDIDERAYQLAYFALMMKARANDRRFLTRGIAPQVYCPKGYADGEEYGSLLNVDVLEEKPQQTIGQLSFDTVDYDTQLNTWNFRRLLHQKYDVVVTNPPYMGKRKKMNDRLAAFVEEFYPNSKMDLFSAFIEQNIKLTKKYGYVAFMTPSVWLYLNSYMNMRQNLISSVFLTSYIELEKTSFEDATVSISTFIFNKAKLNYNGMYFKLSKFIGSDLQPIKVVEGIRKFDQDYMYIVSMDTYSNTPDNRFMYYMSDKSFEIFKSSKMLESVAKPRQGMATSKNELFLKLWFEIDENKMMLNTTSLEAAKSSKKKWFPYNKGGGFRKWYGNNEYVINYKNDGEEVKAFAANLYKSFSRTIKNTQFFFKKSITWSDICGDTFAARSCGNGFIFDVKGSSAFTTEEHYNYILSLLNSTVSITLLNMLNPSVTTQVGDLKQIPILDLQGRVLDDIEIISKKCILNSKTDWDSFETSWDFVKHPFIANKDFAEEHHQGEDFSPATKLEDAYAMWQAQTIRQFEQLKANEEELNRIFIDIYGLQDELTPEVEDKDVTVRTAKLDADVKSFISYAVGCMFGRYSLDVDGLAYAGGEFDSSKYITFAPDSDNVIPICDDEYFEDDIVGRFVDFVKVVYGGSTLEQNLQFIADALGGKGSPREVIRNYFVKDFFNDHVKTYSKRPIYWQFDSGKKNGFKALIYMHRYESDLLARIRTDYVHEQQERYRTQMASLEENMVSATPAERTKMTKAHKKLQEQALEIQKYEEKIHHLADQNISIDLDDGVVKNYAIFSDVVSKIK